MIGPSGSLFAPVVAAGRDCARCGEGAGGPRGVVLVPSGVALEPVAATGARKTKVLGVPGPELNSGRGRSGLLRRAPGPRENSERDPSALEVCGGDTKTKFRLPMVGRFLLRGVREPPGVLAALSEPEPGECTLLAPWFCGVATPAVTAPFPCFPGPLAASFFACS